MLRFLSASLPKNLSYNFLKKDFYYDWNIKKLPS